MNQGRVEESKAALRAFGMPDDLPPLNASRTGSYSELFRAPYLRRVFWTSSLFFLNCIAGLAIATPFILRYVGHLSITGTVIFSTFIWCTSLMGAITSYALIDRLGRRPVAYLSAIPSGALMILMCLTVHEPTLFVASFMVASYFTWLGCAGLTWAWSSELFPTHLRGRSQGVCNSACRLAISLSIFLVPVALATIGFAPLIIAFGLCRFLFALIVNRQPMFRTENMSIDVLAEPAAD